MKHVLNVIRLLTTLAPISRKGFSIFLGAGASFSTAKGFESLKKEAVENFFSNTDDVLDVKSLFEILINEEISSPTDRANILKDLLYKDPSIEPEPSIGHEYLVALCESGYVNNIITTNFDFLIEKAFQNLDILQKLKVVGPDRKEVGNVVRGAVDKNTLVKLHGDLEVGIYNISEQELQEDSYNPYFNELITHLITDSDGVIFSGYSGNEARFASLLENVINNRAYFFEEYGTKRKVFFWLSPELPKNNSPLYQVISPYLVTSKSDRRLEELTFDNGMRKLFHSLPLKDELFPVADVETVEKRVTKELSRSFSVSSLKIETYLSRESIISPFREALDNERLVILTAPSGCGKTTFISNYCCSFLNQKISDIPILISKEDFLPDSKLISIVCKKLFGVKKVPWIMWDIFNTRLSEQKRKIIIIFEGLNEFCHDLNKCSDIFMEIKDLYYLMSTHCLSSMKCIITMRKDSYRFMQINNKEKCYLSHEDVTFIDFDYFTEEECRDVYELYKVKHSLITNYDHLSEQILNYIREPKLLEILSETFRGKHLPKSLHMNSLLNLYLESKAKSQSFRVLDFLPEVAFKCLDSEKYSTGFYASDIGDKASKIPELVSADLLRIGKDNINNSIYFWSHDKIFEYCLSLYFYNLNGRDKWSGLRKFKIDDLHECIVQGYEFSCIHNAAKFLLNEMYVSNIDWCLAFFKKYSYQHTRFIKESTLDIAIYSNEAFVIFAETVLLEDNLPEVVYSSIIQSLQYSNGNTELLWKYFLKSVENGNNRLAIEAVFFYVKLHSYEINNAKKYNIYTLLFKLKLSKKSIPQKIGLLLYLITMLESDEHKELTRLMSQLAYRNFVKINSEELPTIDWFFQNMSWRFLFNATPNHIFDFFNRVTSRKERFEVLLDDLVEKQKEPNAQRCRTIFDFCDRDNYKLEKIILQPVLILLGRSNVKLYKKYITELFENASTPKELDFCTGNLAYYTLVNDDYDEKLSYDLNSRCVTERENLFLDHIYYGVKENYARLFNPIGTFGFTYPKDKEYVELFFNLLSQFIDNQNKNEQLIMRILHALRQTIMLHPKQGLTTLSMSLVGVDELLPTIKQRIVQILAEAAIPYSFEVKRFLTNNHSLFTESDIKAIKFDNETEFHAHPITINDWAKIYKALFSGSNNETILYCLKELNKATSMKSFIDSLAFFKV